MRIGAKLPENLWPEILAASVHRLRQSPRLWQLHISKKLADLGYNPTQEDPCVFRGHGIVVFIYVDDIILLHRRQKQTVADKLVADLMITFKVKDLGPVNRFLAIGFLAALHRFALLWLLLLSTLQNAQPSRSVLQHMALMTRL